MRRKTDTPTYEELAAMLAERDAALTAHAERERVLAGRVEELESDKERMASDLARAHRQIDAYRSMLDRIVEQYRRQARAMWGPSSEATQDQLPLIFNDAEGHADGALPEDGAPAGRKRPRRGKRRVDTSRYEREVVVHDLPEGERTCPACGSPLSPMGFDVTLEYVYVPARMIVREHRTMKYVCRACSARNRADGGETPSAIVRAEAPRRPLPGTWASASLIAHCIHMKFSEAMPVYRLASDLERQCALPVTRQTVGAWVSGAARRWLALVRDAIADELRRREVLHIDETSVVVLKEPGRAGGGRRKCYVWLFAGAACDDRPAYLFVYGPGRDGGVPLRVLGEGWRGTAVTDGYRGYNRLTAAGARRMPCLVHIRREFIEACGGPKMVARLPRDAPEAMAVNWLNYMFRLDSEFDACTPEERRLGRTRPTGGGHGTSLAREMARFQAWCRAELLRAPDGTQLKRALDNALSQWDDAGNCLLDGRLPLDNNLAERAIRPFTVGRKNFLFCDTPSGAEAACAAYSVVTTARANGLDDRKYVEWLLTEMPNDPSLRSGSPDASRYLPWSPDVPESCRATGGHFLEEPGKDDEPIVDLGPLS